MVVETDPLAVPQIVLFAIEEMVRAGGSTIGIVSVFEQRFISTTVTT
jgi:hypothetical protein